VKIIDSRVTDTFSNTALVATGAKSYHRLLLPLGLWLSVLSVAHCQTNGSDPNGLWTWGANNGSANTRHELWDRLGTGGGSSPRALLRLKLDGDALTGSIYNARSQAPGTEAPITGASFRSNRITFRVMQELKSIRLTQRFTGILSADRITGKVESEMNGVTKTNDWVAKRTTEKNEPVGLRGSGAQTWPGMRQEADKKELGLLVGTGQGLTNQTLFSGRGGWWPGETLVAPSATNWNSIGPNGGAPVNRTDSAAGSKSATE
jgi:hypothetical protein